MNPESHETKAMASRSELPPAEQSIRPGQRSARRGWLLIAFAAIVLPVAGALVWPRAQSSEQLLRNGRLALARGDAETALRLAEGLVRRGDPSVESLRLLAESAAGTGIVADAIPRIEAWAARDPVNAGEAWAFVASLEMKRSHARAAGIAIQNALAAGGDDQASVLRLRAQLMGALGQSTELCDSLFRLVRLNAFTMDDLIILASINPFLSDPEISAAMLRAVPEDPAPLLAQARVALNDNRTGDAEPLLKMLLVANPAQWEAQALFGQILAERDDAEFLEWNRRLPTEADDSSRIWLTRGSWLRSRGEIQPACRCFWEALRREPELLAATQQLGQALPSAGESALGAQFLKRARHLQEAADLVNRIDEQKNLRWADALISALERSGRYWEAWAWCSLQAQAAPHDRAVARRLELTAARLAPDQPRTVPQAIPGRNLDWNNVPLPDWNSYRSLSNAPQATDQRSKIRFVDEAVARGLKFEYVNSDDPATPGRRIFESTGGGVAVIDFDGDGWMDLYFAQGGPWPVVPGAGPLDALFRNVSGERFENVTTHTGIVEDEFSQGVAAGDFDNDGFTDLYVANIGRNRLLRNNGDGTFTDVTSSAGLKQELWTSSCAIADLDGDGMPDLFDVNYLQGAGIFNTICTDDHGQPRVCRPTIFEPATDTVSLSRGDGQFSELQSEVGLDLPHGMGLGLIIGQFTDDRRPDIFIANDQTPNYLLINEAPQAGGTLRFSEEGMVRGVALDRDGFALASMGIASGDVNHDGRLDLYITNFANETKSLYLSQPDETYVDATREAGLRAPGFDLLGFGTQFLDADLDGQLDLVVLNGHIDDFGASGQEYRMRAQCFRGVPGAKFVELPASEAGAFFGEKRLGRGLALLDWNHDGRLDFAASYLEGPVALGTNQSTTVGHSLRLKLAGTTSSRDAIGARVTVTIAPGETQIVQLTAGDGYESSNERLIQVATGDREEIPRLEVEWPSGLREAYESVPCGGLLLAIEARGTLVTVPEK